MGDLEVESVGDLEVESVGDLEVESVGDLLESFRPGVFNTRLVENALP